MASLLNTIANANSGSTSSLSLKLQALRAFSPLGAYLEDSELGQLARTCAFVTIHPGRPLPESPFYLVIKGSVSVTDVESGEELTTRQRGSFFTLDMTRHAGREHSADSGRISRRLRHTLSSAALGGGGGGAGSGGGGKAASRRGSRGGVGAEETRRLLGKEAGRMLLVRNEGKLDAYFEAWSVAACCSKTTTAAARAAGCSEAGRDEPLI